MKQLAIMIIEMLKNRNFEAYMIGGSIRNRLHNLLHKENLPIKDYDIVTNASYSEVSNIFNNVSARGEQFKVAVVSIDNKEFEIAQYRGESYPKEGSLRPNKIHSVETLEEDVQRRDFTINGIAEDETGEITDYVCGVEDIANKIIRTIGDADERFAEDPLRMLRAIRFVSQLGYDLHKDTKKGIEKNLYRLKIIPHERVKEEINKTLKGKHVVKALKLMRELKINKYPFYNSILKKEVYMFDSFFNSQEITIKGAYRQLEQLKEKNLSLVDIYFVMYKQSDYEEAVKEFNNVMFLNSEEIFKVLVMIRHRIIIDVPHPQLFLSITDQIGEQRGLEYLKDILNSLANIKGQPLDSMFDLILSQPLFKYQLSINGNDIVEEGLKLGINKKGKWISDALNLIQRKTVTGEIYTLRSIIEEVTNEKHRIINKDR
ncbi:CCA-adding enzyme [compost metagenome]